jgi:outer membrane protein assembly factor BamB
MSGSRTEPEGVEVVLVEGDPLTELARHPVVHGHEPAPVPWGEVPVDDEDLDELDQLEAERPGPPRHPRRWYLVRAAVALALTALVIAVPNVINARMHAADMARLAQLPGFLSPLGAPPTQRWEQPGHLLGEVDGLAVVVDGPGGAIRGVDPVTGTVAWTVGGEAANAARGSCFVLDDHYLLTAAVAAPVPTGGAQHEVIACFGDPPGTVSPSAQSPEATVWFIDATTGETLEPLRVHGPVLISEPVGRDLLTGTVTPDGHLALARYDPRKHSTLWTYTSAGVMFGTDPLMIRAVDRRADAMVITTYLSDTLAISLADGRAVDPVAAEREPRVFETTALPDGMTAVWRDSGSAAPGAGQVTSADGRVLYVLTGPVLRPDSWDGTLAQTLVVGTSDGSRLRGLDVTTGRRLWSTEVGSLYPLVQAMGVMLVGDQSTVSAVDLRDGDVLWSARRENGIFGPGLTDGEVVLVPTREGVDLFLSARDLHDGTERWTATLPRGTTHLVPVGGTLIGETGLTAAGGETVVGFR